MLEEIGEAIINGFIVLFILGILIGLFLGLGLPWVWGLIKPIIHSVTA